MISEGINPVEGKNKGFLGKTFLLMLFLPVFLLVVASYFNDVISANEFSANMSSFLIALLCWGVVGRELCARVFGRRLFWVMTIAILFRIAANFIHFYYIFAPLAGIDSSAVLTSADYTGDLTVIFNSALLFNEAFDHGGLLYAIFGNYYRAMNNPGVAVIYGSLFRVFGAYGTIAISWTVVYSAFASLLIGLIGLVQRLPVRFCRTAALLVFFMPGFFVFPPLYRDNFIIFLLVLSAYTAVLLTRKNIFLLSAAIFLESILLLSLRSVYLIIPPAYCAISILNFKSRKKFIIYAVIFGFFTLVAIFLSWDFLNYYFVRFLERLGGGFESELSDFAIMTPFKAMGLLFFYPAAAVFSLLAPMPWWQSVSPTLLAYQIFFYPQTWYSLAMLVALFRSYKLGLMTKETSLLVMFALFIFLLALFGSLNFAAGYVQVALPFVILAAIRYLSANWKKCFVYSAALIIVVHIVLWII